MVEIVIFQGIWTNIAKKSYIFVIFQAPLPMVIILH